jgi:phosphodiesterase/alkaline phosphatase D-like protein
VDYGLTTRYGAQSVSGTLQTSHSVVITGLQVNTLYHYRITATDAASNVTVGTDQTLTTAS